MFLNKDRQSFTKAVAIVILLQGLVWFALSLAGIIVYSSPPDKMKNDIHSIDRYIDYISRVIYDEFIGGDRSRVIRPKDFAAFLWIYTILSALWIAASIDQYTAIRFKKSRQSVITLVLGVLVLLTSIIDLVFVSLLARDYHTCPFNLTIVTPTSETMNPTTVPATTSPTTTVPTIPVAPTTDPTKEFLAILQTSLSNTGSTSNGTAIDCQLANGIIMTVAARGFVLWVINVVLAISLITIGAKVLRSPALLNYENNTIPRVRGIESRKQSSPNDMVFLGDNDIFIPPLNQQNNNRNRNGIPVAITNKNKAMYY